jgi:hypothetical protein
MAKAKKQESGTGGKASAKSAPKKASGQAGKKSASGGASGGGSPGAPLIDTSLAAQAAAKMVLHRATGTTPTTSGAGTASPQPQAEAGAKEPEKRETSTFKQLKQGLSKSGSQNLGGVLGGVQSGKKSNQPFGGGNQNVRNQTFGADVNRSGVPRRTGG